jgi:hypothetical protein
VASGNGRAGYFGLVVAGSWGRARSSWIDLVVGSDIAMDDLGMRPLKGVEGTWQLFAVRP